MLSLDEGVSVTVVPEDPVGRERCWLLLADPVEVLRNKKNMLEQNTRGYTGKGFLMWTKSKDVPDLHGFGWNSWG
jgi:hypothetical protein